MRARFGIAALALTIAAVVIGCTSVSEPGLGMASHSPAGASLLPTAAESGAAAAVDPCSILTNEEVSRQIGREVTGEAHLSYFESHQMRDCVYFAGGGSHGNLVLALRQRDISAGSDRLLARELFGQSMSEGMSPSAHGAIVYTGCLHGRLPCVPAVAVSTPPHFAVLFFWVDPDSTTPEYALKMLAQLVGKSFDAR